MLGAGNRMAGNEADALRYMRANDLDHMFLDRADIGQDRALFEMRTNRGSQRAIGAHGGAEDDEIGVSYGIPNGLRISIGSEEAMRAVADLLKSMDANA